MNSSTKDINSKTIRIYYSAFLYTEYILRNAISANKYILNAVCDIKKTIKSINNKYSPQLILDSMIELECYYESYYYKCKLFCGSIFKKYTNRKEYKLSTVFDEDIMYVKQSKKYLKTIYIYKKLQSILCKKECIYPILILFKMKIII